MTRGQREFERVFAAAEPRLRAALVARYGPSTGRAVTVDALSYAWEHWDRLSAMANPIGYLFRVGQSASRAYSRDEIPWTEASNGPHHDAPFEPELLPALAALPEQQRVVVTLVHGLAGHTAAPPMDANDVRLRQVAGHGSGPAGCRHLHAYTRLGAMD